MSDNLNKDIANLILGSMRINLAISMLIARLQKRGIEPTEKLEDEIIDYIINNIENKPITKITNDFLKKKIS